MSKNNNVATPQEKETLQNTENVVLNKKGNPKGPARTERTTPRNQHPRQDPPKKEPAEIKLPENKSNTPTAKVKDKEQIKKEREENFKKFRINAFKRRAKRLGLSDEETEAKLKELIEQMNAPHDYDIIVTFHNGDGALMKEILANNKLVYKIMSLNTRKQEFSYFYMVGNQEVLDTLRKVMPSSAKIMPYVKKKEPVLPVSPPKCRGPKKYTKAQKRAMAAEAKKARKKAKLKYFADRSEHAKARKKAVNKKKRTEANHKILFQKRCEKASKKRQKTQSGTTVQLKAKKGSTALKKASTSLKQAA